MLKRSFAEFHAQRAAPDALAKLEAARAQLAALRARPWPHSYLGTTREEVEEYHSLTVRIDRLSGALQVGSRVR